MLRRFADQYHLPLLLAAAFVYVAVASGYTFRLKPDFLWEFDYFALQAGAWLQGRLDLGLAEPGFDMSPYKGKVFLYWGPSNAVIPYLCLLVFGDEPGMTVRSIFYLLLGLLFFTRVQAAIREQFFPRAPRWLPGLFACGVAF